MTVNIPVPSIKNWKTTLFGLLALVVGVIQTSHAPSIGAALMDPKVQMSILVALVGFFAKDHNVTGGTTGQPSTPTAIADSNHAPAVGLAAPAEPPNAG